jgi:cell division transport system ATP-binding protein
MILFDGVSKKYPNSKIAVEHINLKIEDGEFVFFVGHSGAGKTTLLKLLIQEILPTAGSVYMDDWVVNKLSKKQLPYLRRKVGFVFQDFKLLHDRTVAENIGVSLEILGKKQKEQEMRVKEVLDIVKLSGKDFYFPKQLSLGEQQRIAIGRAIAGGARVLLADEPTGNLDPTTSNEIIKIFQSINKLGTTVIMATHNTDIVNNMQKRVVTLSDGKITRDAKKSRYS